MKIIEAINRIDDLIHNTYSSENKVQWLSQLDSMVKRLIIDTHHVDNPVSFNGYTPYTPMDTELLVPAPFDDMYIKWLEAQIHYYNGEYDKYNNAILVYNTMYEAYGNHYNKHNTPNSAGKQFIF